MCGDWKDYQLSGTFCIQAYYMYTYIHLHVTYGYWSIIYCTQGGKCGRLIEIMYHIAALMHIHVHVLQHCVCIHVYTCTCMLMYNPAFYLPPFSLTYHPLLPSPLPILPSCTPSSPLALSPLILVVPSPPHLLAHIISSVWPPFEEDGTGGFTRDYQCMFNSTIVHVHVSINML